MSQGQPVAGSRKAAMMARRRSMPEGGRVSVVTKCLRPERMSGRSVGVSRAVSRPEVAGQNDRPTRRDSEFTSRSDEMVVVGISPSVLRFMYSRPTTTRFETAKSTPRP